MSGPEKIDSSSTSSLPQGGSGSATQVKKGRTPDSHTVTTETKFSFTAFIRSIFKKSSSPAKATSNKKIQGSREPKQSQGVLARIFSCFRKVNAQEGISSKESVATSTGAELSKIREALSSEPIDLDALLETEAGSKSIEKYCNSRHSPEQYSFVKAVQQYKSACKKKESPEILKNLHDGIVDLYIKEGAKQRISLSSSNFASAADPFSEDEAVRLKKFDRAVKTVEGDWKDEFPNSPACLDLYKVCGIKRAI